MIAEAELNRGFFARYGEPSRAFWKAWRAELSFYAQKLEPKQSRAELRLGPNTTYLAYYEMRTGQAREGEKFSNFDWILPGFTFLMVLIIFS